MEEQPPRYSMLEATGWSHDEGSLEGAHLQDDGRIQVDLDSKLCRTVSKLFPFTHKEEKPVTPPSYTEEAPISLELRLNIVIQVVGSRGDVQPFIALGNELQRHGHRVRLATHDVFENFVRDAQLEFYPIGGDPSELMAYMVKNPGLIPRMKSLQGGEIQKKRAMIAEMLRGCWNSCIADDLVTHAPFVADAIIANPPSFAHIHCAQALSIPVHFMFTMPWSSTKSFPHPLANLKYSTTEPKVANYISYSIVEWMTWQGLGDLINEWRYSLDLEPIPVTEGPNLAETLTVPFTYCWSPSLIPRPSDWPSYIDVCGFFFRSVPDYSPPTELDLFLRSGSRPVYIGFGSIVIDDPAAMTDIILQAVKSLGIRAIISRGWSKLGNEQASADDEFFYLDDCPHEWLFQHVDAVVHHGGAGTTACGLRFGRATVIIPFFGDQLFWGNMVASRGLGPKPIPYRSLNAQNLADAIQFCLQPSAQAAGQDVANQMAGESGVTAAVTSFHRNLPLENMRCQFLPSQPAVWRFKKASKSNIHLSKVAAEILIQSHRIKLSDIKPHKTRPIYILNRRWDPVTGLTSSLIGTSTDIIQATGDVFYGPYREFSRNTQLDNSVPEARPRSCSTASMSTTSIATESSKVTSKWKTTGTALGGSAKSAGKALGFWYKGVLIDMPLAVTEGLRAVPRLYGDDVKDHGPIKDWKTGFMFAGKNFAHGMTEGVAEVFTQPYQGGKKEGAMGVLKGIGKGTIGITTKVSSAAVGLVAYPAHGMMKSMYTATHSKTSKHIIEARVREGKHFSQMTLKEEESSVLRKFEASERELAENVRTISV